MMLAYHCIIPPDEWYHNPKIHNIKDYTVAMILAE